LALVATTFALVGDLPRLIGFVGFTLAIFAALTVGALFILRRRNQLGAYRTFGYPVTPLLFIAVSVWIAYSRIKMQPTQSAIVGLGLLVVALVYVFVAKRTHPKLPEAGVVDE